MRTANTYVCSLLATLAVLGFVGSAARCATSTVTYQVSASNDDGYAWSATGQDVGSGFLMIGDGKSYAAPYYMSAMRFTNLSIPRSAAVIEARLRIRSLKQGIRGRIYGIIQAESADSAVDFGSRYIAAAPKSAASVNWDHKFAWATNTWQISPDIAAPIQEIINRPGWSSGNSMAVFYNTRKDSGKDRMFASFDVAAAYAPILEVTYLTHTISGYVRTSAGAPIDGVTVSAGSDIEPALTDGTGYYELLVPPGWSGTVTPGKAGWGFNPASQVYNNVTSDKPNQDYTAFQPRISGYVLDRDGAGVAGVSISVTNGGTSGVTNAGGYYEVTVPYGWSGTVTPVKAGWHITPESWTYSNVVADQTNQNYTAFQPRISGYVKDGTGTGMQGAAVSANNGGGSDTTDSNGYYEVTVPYDWSGTITPSKAGWGFNPTGRLYNNIVSDQTNQDYTAIQPEISGYIKDETATGMEGVFVSANNAGGSDTTDANGYYELTVPYDWSGTVTPAKAGWGFIPPSKLYNNIVSDQTNQDYAAFQPKISGYIKDETATGMEGVSVSANNHGGSDTTDANGYYELTVPYNWSGTITPSKAGWGFNPAGRPYSHVVSDQTSQHYTAFQPNISGYVKDGTGTGTEAVLVSANNGGGSDTTDSSGYYEVTVPYDWSGAITPSKTGWGFDPAGRPYNNVVSDQTNQHYTAFQPKISGYVTDRDGATVEAAMVSADNGGTSDTTDANGYYVVTVPYDWSGAVTASKTGWDISPETRTYSHVTTDQLNQGYTAFQPRISGYVTDRDGAAAEAVTVSADNGGTSYITDATGYYEVIVPYNWSGVVTPNKPDWGFDPESHPYSSVITDQTDQNYTTFQPTISGYIAESNGVACDGILVATGDALGSDVTDSNGYYQFDVPYNWSGTVTPQKTFWFFEPPGLSYENLIDDVPDQNYVAIAGVRISGYVRTIGSGGIEGVEVSADNGGRSDTTDISGFYELAVLPGWSGTVTPNEPGRSFDPADRSYSSLTAHLTEQNFTSLPLIVRADGSGGFPTIQAAIDAAFDGDEVVVEPGTYTGVGNRDIDSLGKAIIVRGTNPDDPATVAATIVDCQGMGRGFYFRDIEDVNPVLNGLTITNGYADKGGGIYCRGSATVMNCLITGNAAWYGGGIHCDWDDRPTITDCTISYNMALQGGGGLAGCYGPVNYCLISDNSASIGGGAWACLELNNCIISGNHAGSGGGVAECGQLNSCLVVGNRAWQDGGGMYFFEIWSVTSVVTNCTVAWNRAASGFGGGISLGYSNIVVSNSIIWGNTDSNSTVASAQIYCDYVPEVAFSCIQDEDANDANIPFGGADSNNIDDYPMFVRDANDGGDGWGDDPCTPAVDESANDDYGDLHLLTGSPCINTGSPFIWFSEDDVDIDGQPRLMGPTVDMGADEFPYPMIVVTKPQGGEVWVSGSWHQITWATQIYEGTVDILLSTDDGGSWQTIQAGLADTGAYTWHLPDAVDSYQCVIAVVPTVPDPNVDCVESGLFTIHPDAPGPLVTSKWKSLGGDFDRIGLSEDYGPELGCIKWQFEVDGAVSASVTVGPNDTVYIPCEDGNLYKLDANGVLLWSYDANSPLISSPTIGPDGTVYVGSKSGKLYAIDIDGNVRWTHGADGFIYSSPAVSADGNTVYVCSQDGRLYALGRDGSELWNFETTGFGVIDGSIFASPAIGADGAVYIGGLYEPNLYALDPNDGSVKWVCNFEYLIDPYHPWEGTEFGWLFASPVVAPDGTIYQTLLYDPNLYAVDPNDGNIIWATHLAQIAYDCASEYDCMSYSPWFEPHYYEYRHFEIHIPWYDRWACGYVYRNALYNVGDSGWSEPVLGPDGTIYVSFDDPYLRAVEPNGAIKWIRHIGARSGYTETCGDFGCGWYGATRRAMGFSLTVGDDGLIYAASNDSNLYVINPDGLEIARFDSNDHWLDFPVISADNTMVVTDSRDNSMLISHTNNKVWAVGGDDCDGQQLDLYWQDGPQDLDCDGAVDSIDFALLARNWLRCTDCWNPGQCIFGQPRFYEPYLTGDINRDRYVDFIDVAAVVDQWLSGH